MEVRWFLDGANSRTYNLRVLILEGIGFHIPNDLMGKQLGEFGSLDDVSFNITEDVITKGLDDLRDIEEGHVDGMTFQCPHGILNDEWVITIGWQKICYSRHWIHRCPVKQILALSEPRGRYSRVTYLELEGYITR